MGGIYKFKPFARYARKAGLSDAMLCRAAREIESGRIDADLGGGVIKQRVARDGEGRSGGFRTIVLFRSGTNLFFIRGFAKNERDNISLTELALFKDASAIALNLSKRRSRRRWRRARSSKSIARFNHEAGIAKSAEQDARHHP